MIEAFSRAIAWARATVSLALFLLVAQLTKLAAWVWPENAEHFLHGLERGIERERDEG